MNRGWARRRIARTLGVSRETVRRVIESGTAEVPRLDRSEKATPYRERILELFVGCKGNLVRVHEELLASGCEISYQALTAFCRRHEVGKKRQPRAGTYYFEFGQEMQHDTSPHRVTIGGTRKLAHAASLIFCRSRMMFFQYYPAFTRFECKLFLTDAVTYFGASCASCMIDNTHVVVLEGTGANMVPVPEMVAFAKQLGFVFVAHEKGDANRSARVERPFDYIDNNFNAGRSASDWKDLNRQAIEWCDRDNVRSRRSLQASPRELFAQERAYLAALPEWLPEVYRLHHRLVDVNGYVSVNTNRYSVPLAIPVGRRLEARETKDRVDLYEGPRLIASHEREWERLRRRITDPSHRSRRPPRQPEVTSEEKTILELAPELASYVAQLRARGRGLRTRRMRTLLSLLRDYPREPLVSALVEAERYGLYDLQRVEHMILKRVAGDYFLLSDDAQGGHDD